MRIAVLAVFDHKVRAYAQPFFAQTVASGERSFIAACDDKTSLLARFPVDYGLFHVGWFDDSSGMLEPLTPPVFVASPPTQSTFSEAVSAS